jgi:outer membrane autotransporter protein
MIKTAFAAAAALAFAPAAALAGPYVNVETNAGWTGSDYNGAATDFHVGYEGALGEDASYYVQGGATLVSPDGGDSDTVPSGKAGIGVAVTEKLGAYGEVSFVGSGDSDIDRGYGGKVGLKYSF